MVMTIKADVYSLTTVELDKSDNVELSYNLPDFMPPTWVIMNRILSRKDSSTRTT
jgi:hypothetical protein